MKVDNADYSELLLPGEEPPPQTQQVPFPHHDEPSPYSEEITTLPCGPSETEYNHYPTSPFPSTPTSTDPIPLQPYPPQSFPSKDDMFVDLHGGPSTVDDVSPAPSPASSPAPVLPVVHIHRQDTTCSENCCRGVICCCGTCGAVLIVIFFVLFLLALWLLYHFQDLFGDLNDFHDGK